MPRIVFSPQILPKPVVDLARDMAPAGFELVIADPGTPAFTAAIREAEYFLGFVRGGFACAVIERNIVAGARQREHRAAAYAGRGARDQRRFFHRDSQMNMFMINPSR